MPESPDDKSFMEAALKQAALAYELGEIPVGAVIVTNNKIIARGYNQTENLKDPTAHAEMIAITSACHFMGAKYLPNCTLYVTLEPCIMCFGAIKWAQLGRIVFGADDPKGGFSHFINKSSSYKMPDITKGILEQECSGLLKTFFLQLRGK